MRPPAGEGLLSAAKTAIIHGMTLGSLLITTSVIIGARNEAQLDDNLAAPALKPDASQLDALDQASALPSEYPGWMIAMQARDRLEALSPEQRFAKTT